MFKGQQWKLPTLSQNSNILQGQQCKTVQENFCSIINQTICTPTIQQNTEVTILNDMRTWSENWHESFPSVGEHPKRVAATVLHSKCHILLYSSAARYIDLIRLLKSRFSDTITDKILHLFAKPMNILGEIASILLDRHCYYDKKTIKCTFTVTTIVQLLEENN